LCVGETPTADHDPDDPEEHDLVIIGGGVAGYVAAIKAGQEGLKVSDLTLSSASMSFARCVLPCKLLA
jgi:anaerobic glycerol-3-phosphate dehydrogenase